MNTFGDRLKSERERLGMTQPVFAKFGGVLKGAQINYEKGERMPDVSYLVAVAAVGVDVSYLLTGLRLPPDVAAHFQSAAAVTVKQGNPELSETLVEAMRKQGQAAFNQAEVDLVAQIRALSPEQRALVSQTVKALASRA